MKESVDSFLNHLVVEKGFSRNTLEAYRNDLYQFIRFAQERTNNFGDHHTTPGPDARDGWERVDLGLLTDYVSTLRGRKSYRDTTTARKVAALKSFFNFLVQEEAIQQDPTEALSAPRVGRSLPKFLSEAEVERLLEEAAKVGSAEGRRDRAILELLYATGLRVSELVSLNTNDVNLQEGYVRCMGKGSKERIAYMYPTAVGALGTYMNEARPSLLSPTGAAGRSAGGHGPAKDGTDQGRKVSTKEEKALFLNQRGTGSPDSGCGAFSRLTPEGPPWIRPLPPTYCATVSPPICCGGGLP